MEVNGSFTEVDTVLTYTQLKIMLAKHLNRASVPTSTLSRWMNDLGYSKGKPGKKRNWELEDLFALYCYGTALSWGYSKTQAIQHTVKQVEKWRETNHGTEYRPA